MTIQYARRYIFGGLVQPFFRPKKTIPQQKNNQQFAKQDKKHFAGRVKRHLFLPLKLLSPTLEDFYSVRVRKYCGHLISPQRNSTSDGLRRLVGQKSELKSFAHCHRTDFTSLLFVLAPANVHPIEHFYDPTLASVVSRAGVCGPRGPYPSAAADESVSRFTLASRAFAT